MQGWTPADASNTQMQGWTHATDASGQPLHSYTAPADSFQQMGGQMYQANGEQQAAPTATETPAKATEMTKPAEGSTDPPVAAQPTSAHKSPMHLFPRQETQLLPAAGHQPQTQTWNAAGEQQPASETSGHAGAMQKPQGATAQPPIQTAASQEVIEPKAGAELLTELRLAELKRLIDRDAKQLRKTPDLPEEQGVQGSGSAWRGERRARARDKGDAPIVEGLFSRASASTIPPGLDTPKEQHLKVLVDFMPASRTYGEMPVRAGEQVTITYEAIDEWIFGWKHGPKPDEGWLPAVCLGIGVSLSDADTTDQDQPQRAVPVRRRGRGHGKDAATVSTGRAVQSSTSQQADSNEGESDAWHHHGNWWSKQRHLKSTDENNLSTGPPRATMRLPPAAAAAVAAATADKGRVLPPPGRASAIQPQKAQVERPQRQRPALSSLLDRLKKPLVAPKSSDKN